ncbi:hypothetical protein LB543_13685 [Mesorhizobium sp. ESP7-2]|uniref:hypothetical protein n=1 Tax=Mesorhizobium sp. ESP7-2 TaxID=2876622 RepID=UPI001CC9C5AD|nr:hypothetical protein [Mesorhizobium sp. ESP7-2]MBZ9707775.1 hypothetical protein [Mesorhizobium sp. ESP7-2]
MSDNYLRLVPYDPRWYPAQHAATAAVNAAHGLFPAAGHIAVEYEQGATFFDAGANTESVHCPFCGSDIEEWWGDAMNQAAESRFEDLSVTTPCCHRPTSLNDLRYVWPAAFGVCALTVISPGVNSVSSEQLRTIEQAMGSPLKVIWQHL